MPQVFSTYFYALLDPGSTLFFVTPLVALTFEIFPEVLHDPLVVSSPLEENVRTDRVYKDCPIVISISLYVQTWLSYPCMILMLSFAWIGFTVVIFVSIVVVEL